MLTLILNVKLERQNRGSQDITSAFDARVVEITVEFQRNVCVLQPLLMICSANFCWRKVEKVLLKNTFVELNSAGKSTRRQIHYIRQDYEKKNTRDTK